MSGTAFAALGTQVWIGDGGSPTETYFKVGRVQDVSGPKDKTDIIDVTTHDSATVNGGDGYKEFIASLQDGQQITFPLVLDPNESTHNETATVVGTNAGGLKYLKNLRVRRNMRLVMPMVSPMCRVRLVGIVVGFELDFKVTGALMASVTIQVSGKPTMEQGGANSN
jgi:hypothetical protein